MHISWLGQTCIRLQTKFQEEDVTVVIDAYKPSQGEFPRSFSPTIALFSKGLTAAVTLSQNPFVLDTLGEIELKEAMVTTWPTAEGTIIFKINADGISLVHLGAISQKPTLADLENLGHIDILCVPVGGGNFLNAEDAAALVTALEPRVVIPMAHQCDTDRAAKPVSEFVKELGLKPETTDKKIIVKKKDLPQEETKLMILEKS